MIRPLSEAERAANWAAVRKSARRLFWLAMLPFLALLWATGYATGLLDGAKAPRREPCPETISKESTNENL